tara:strand:+ start:604 stop:837 length:234 start_codon:yes stop_codon:yes gene_type:complete
MIIKNKIKINRILKTNLLITTCIKRIYFRFTKETIKMSFKDFSTGQKPAKSTDSAAKPAAEPAKPDAKPAAGTAPAK